MAAPPIATRTHKQSTCPAVGALLKNGDLIPDKNGVITKEQTLAAFMRVGISKKTAVESTDANFQSSICPNCPTSIDPFNMNTIKNGQNLPSPIGGAKATIGPELISSDSMITITLHDTYTLMALAARKPILCTRFIFIC